MARTTSDLGTATALQALADQILGEPVVERIRRESAAKRSMRLIVRDIARDTDNRIDITEDTARSWVARSAA